MKKFAFLILLPALLTFGFVINSIEAGKNALKKYEGLQTNFFPTESNNFTNKYRKMFHGFKNSATSGLEIPDFNFPTVSPDVKKAVTFQLYTNESGDEFHILGANKSNFDTKRHTYIITHGYMSSSNSSSCTLVRYALQNTTDANIIIVNWSPLSVTSYDKARSYVSPIGEYIGKFINILYKNGMKPEATTLIGHSLGAHIMGIAGQTVNEKVNHTIGLDPAGPLFIGVPANDRLSPDDALYVEVIHTNAGGFGYPSDLGDYDFYPNGGKIQPGCLNSACYHARCYDYLAEQISNPAPAFCSLKCTSYLQFIQKTCTNETAFMGEINSHPANPGTYYLKTNNAKPFSLSKQCA